MGTLAAEVSLHCVICFEEFCIRDRPPVVLPCGHTYVCMICAKRLKRCMECREPLFWNPPSKGPPPALNMNTRAQPPSRYAPSHRGRYQSGPRTPPHPSMTAPLKEEPVPLPLPKNVVLMGMIEAAERQARLLEEARAKEEVLQLMETVPEAAPEERESRLDPILSGISAFVGTCGTYAVREPAGLAVLPFDPNKQHQAHKDQSEEEKKAEELKEPFTIEEGQKVQVVGVDEGVYQLARGAGFIVATVNQMVKVGGPLETSCKLEGMLQSVIKKQEELQKEIDEINMLVNGLKERIKFEQELPESHPVISRVKNKEDLIQINDENDVGAVVSGPSTPPMLTRQGASSPIGLQLTQSTDSTEVELGEPHTPAPEPQHHISLRTPPLSCPMPDSRHLCAGLDHHPYIDAVPAGLPRYRVNSDDELHGLSWGFGCGTTLFGERLIEHENDQIMAISFDDSLVDGDATTYSMLSRGAATAHTMPSRSIASLDPRGASPLQSGSFDGIDFRTGLSGHTGLSQAKKKSSPSARRNIRMMSEHRGVAGARGHLQRRTTPQGQFLGPADFPPQHG